jgi:hypothetical protein
VIPGIYIEIVLRSVQLQYTHKTVIRACVAVLSFKFTRAHANAYVKKKSILVWAHTQNLQINIFDFIFFFCFLFDTFATFVSLFSYCDVLSTAITYPALFQ